MKKLTEFMEAKTAYFLIFPAVFFILLFSVLPIASSLRYAFFDFQLNDQSKAGMYTQNSFNLKLYQETVGYLDHFLQTDLESVQKSETKQAIRDVQGKIKQYEENIAKNIVSPDMRPVVRISEQQKQDAVIMCEDIQQELKALYAMHDQFSSPQDAMAAATDLNVAVIPGNFVGVKNITEAVQDKRVQTSFCFTLVFTILSVFLELCFGIALSLIMNRAMRGRGMIRTISLIPWAIPTSVAALMWSYLYDGSSGIIAQIFSNINLLQKPTDLLLTSGGALFSIVLADVWKTTPYMALLLLAGLQVIPESLYESSALDGANRFRQFQHITLPLLKPSIFVALLFRTLDAFRVFDLIYILTGGGPGGTTESVSLYAYKLMFAQTRFGYGSAVVILMALAVGLIAFAYIKLLNVQLISTE